MGTRETILDSARQLFNETGEANVSASDIATLVDLSPGNLHYHFPGKQSIHHALFDAFQRDMIMLLGPAVQAPDLFSETPKATAIEQSWLFFTVVMEKIFSHRYLYDAAVLLVHRDRDIDRGMRRLLGLKQKVCLTVAQVLIGGEGKPLPHKLDRLAEAMCFSLTSWPSYSRLKYPTEAEFIVRHRGVLQVLAHCAPHLGAERQAFYLECDHMYSQMIQGSDVALD